MEHQTEHHVHHKAEKMTLSTPVSILIAGTLVAGAILYALVYVPNHKLAVQNPTDTTGTPQTKDIGRVTDKDHVRGDYKTAQLTLVEYSDLQCPYCAVFHPTAKQLVANYGGKVAWVYRHFPLSQIHPQALPAAIASECVASLKGGDAFWRFIDGSFTAQKSIGINLYRSLAAKEGISTTDLDACIKKNDTTIIAASYNEAAAAGGNGTPFTVILDKNGKTLGTFPGAIGYEQGKAQIDALLAK